MPPAPVIVPPAAASTVTPEMASGSDDSEQYAGVMTRLGLTGEPAAPATPAPATPDLTNPAPATPATPVVPEPAAPVNPNAAAAAKRIADKNAQTQAQADLEAARARVAELEAASARIPEIEASLVETRTLAEQREVELKTYKDRYQNEVNTLDPALVYEAPLVQEAQAKYNTVSATLFPTDISNPDNEEPDRRFDIRSLDNPTIELLQGQLRKWEEYEGMDLNANLKADAQHVVLSNIAAAIGVDKNTFIQKTVNGQTYNVISPTHPVYKHLRTQIRPFVAARLEVEAAKAAVSAERVTAMQGIVGTRVTNSRNMVESVGVGLTGPALDAVLQKNPDNAFAKVMKVIESDAELMAELKTNIDTEVAVNGHFRPQLDLTETDPTARTQTAQTYLQRIGLRTIHGAMAPVVMKKLLSVAAENAQLKIDLAAAQAEANRTLIQSEPGGAGTALNPAVAANGAPQTDPAMARMAERLGLSLTP